MPRFDPPEYLFRLELQSAKQVLTEFQTQTGKRNKIWEKDRRKAAVERIGWKEMLTQPKFAKKVSEFMKSLGLTDQFRSVALN